MLMLRLQRVGRRNDPAFRLVVTEKRSKPQSGEIEILGSFHPKTKATVLKNERILYWLSRGAKVSPTAHNMLISKGVIKGKKIDLKIPVKMAEKEPEATVVAKEEVKKEELAEEMPKEAVMEEESKEPETAEEVKEGSAEDTQTEPEAEVKKEKEET